jgi:archaellum biogenesis ATPase FlaH
MTYDINTISQSDLLKLLLSVKEQYSIDAIDEEKAAYELEQQEKALLRHKQLENEIAKSGFSRNEIFDFISVKNGKELFATADDSDKEPRQIFGHFLYEGEISILFGETGVGKSLLAYDIAFFVSGGGHTWEGLESPNIPTLYIDLGMSTKQFVSRYKTAEPYIPDTFHRAMIDPTELSEKEILPEVKKMIAGMQSIDNPPKFIIIDNITNGFGTMTASTKMRNLLSEFKNLKEKFGLTILLIANSKTRKTRKEIELNDLGGWTNHLNFIDSAFAIGQSRCGKKYKYIKQIKTREDKGLMDVMSVMLESEPFLRYTYLGYNSEWGHLDGSLPLTPEQEAIITNMLMKGEHSYSEIADFLDVSKEEVINFAIENRL